MKPETTDTEPRPAEQPPAAAADPQTLQHKPAVNTPESVPITRPLLIAAALIIFGMAGLMVTLAVRPGTKPAAKTVVKTTTNTAAASTTVRLSLFAGGLPKPTAIVSTRQPGDTRLFVVDQDGIVTILDKGGKAAAKPFVDITGLVRSGGEEGLLGLAFSPHYATDGYFFVNYIDKTESTVIARYHTAKDTGLADPASAQVLLTLQQPYPNHNGGALLLGPDGYLYAALGDGGSGGDPGNRAQDLGVLFGKILRLDVSQLPYKIPATNPFAKQAGAKGEIWDYGLRNPWRISFDRKTGELYIADVGQGDREEVDVEAANSKGGLNYGWRCYEANSDFNLTGCKVKSNYVFPVLDYDHTGGRCSITGGYVYRGSKYPGLAGKYFYGDYCGGQLYSMQKQGGKWQSTEALKTPYAISTFGEDAAGELYMADYTAGAVYQIQAAN